MRNLSRRIPIRGRGYSVAYQTCGPLMCNMYSLVCDITGDAAIVDPSLYLHGNNDDGDLKKLQTHLSDKKATVKHILLTHGHIDHVVGVPTVMELWPGAKLHLHPMEEENYSSAMEQGAYFGMHIPKGASSDLPPPTDELRDGQILTIGETIRLQVVHTPGHAPGHVAFVDDAISPEAQERHANKKDDATNGNVIIGGDLLFRGTVGRTDFFNSSIDDLYASIRRLYEEFDDDSIVLSGHTTPTKLQIERKTNPFVDYALGHRREWYEEAKERHGWN